MTSNPTLPVAIIGAGPVGLAAAAHLIKRGLTPLVFERGKQAGAIIAQWSHVRVFSPWEYNVDATARSLLEAEGWRMPDPDYLPTGGEIIRDYLAPLAAHPAIAPHLRLNAEVLAITRQDRSKLASEGRDDAPFTIVWRNADGGQERTLAGAVIDASGTWVRPNPIGLDGLTVEGEIENSDRISYGIPDMLGTDKAIYEGRHTLVIGGGHSATNAALDLLTLKDQAPNTRVTWATRAGGIDRLMGGGLNDALPGRGQLGVRATQAVQEGHVTLLSPFAVRRLTSDRGAILVEGQSNNEDTAVRADRIIVATGFRPDLTFLSELRLTLDPAVEATPALAPLIDPNLHSCGTVRPHGVVELSHPEKNFYIVGMKSYGRAPTFLMVTGYEQARSVVAEIAGDPIAARQVKLKLPETGVCQVASAVPDAGLQLVASAANGCCTGVDQRDIAI